MCATVDKVRSLLMDSCSAGLSRPGFPLKRSCLSCPWQLHLGWEECDWAQQWGPGDDHCVLCPDALNTSCHHKSLPNPWLHCPHDAPKKCPKIRHIASNLESGQVITPATDFNLSQLNGSTFDSVWGVWGRTQTNAIPWQNFKVEITPIQARGPM